MTGPMSRSMASTVTPPGRSNTAGTSPEDGSPTCSNRRFDTDPAGTAIEDMVNPVAKLLGHVGGSRRAEAAEWIGARRCDGKADFAKQFQCERVIGYTYRDCVESRRDEIGHGSLFRKHQSQGARPELLH